MRFDLLTRWSQLVCDNGRNAPPVSPPPARAATDGCGAARPSEQALATRSSSCLAAIGCAPCPTAEEPFVDIFAVEACSSLQNLLDKRSRFAPSTHSLLAVCPVPWLLAPVTAKDPTPRWEATGVLRHAPVTTVYLPVRDIRVMYALKTPHYEGFEASQVPHAHEFFVPMAALTAEAGHEDPRLRALLSRATARANFL
jgi:hypothetical protein